MASLSGLLVEDVFELTPGIVVEPELFELSRLLELESVLRPLSLYAATIKIMATAIIPVASRPLIIQTPLLDFFAGCACGYCACVTAICG